jgi:hypothetical protein
LRRLGLNHLSSPIQRCLSSVTVSQQQELGLGVLT